MPKPLVECFRIVASAIGTCSLPGTLDPSTAGEELLDESFSDLGFDSLAYMEFCIAIHLETGIELTVGSLDELGTPAAVARHLSELQ
jgi:acyl carrier protein